MLKKITLAGMLVTSAVAAHAYPTALGVIPVANILRHRETSWYYALTGVEQNVSKRWFHSAGVEVGILNQVEVGVDTNFLGQNAGNFKWMLFDNPKSFKNLTLSVGAMNIQGKNIDPYAIATYAVGPGRFHVGYWRNSGVRRGMFGYDFGLSNGWTGSVEHVSGPGAYSIVAVNIPIPKVEGFAIMPMLTVPVDRSTGVQLTLNFTYAMKF